MLRTEVTWDSGNGQITVPGMIEDRSISGLGIQIGKSIPIGTPVKVKFRNDHTKCVVKRCIKADFGVFIGVSFEDTPQDSKEQ